MAKRKTIRKSKYKAAEGSRISDKDAQLLGRVFDALREKHGHLNRQLIVDEAKNPRSPLHRFFEWDTEAAAEKYWLSQAGHLLRSVRVVIESTGEENRETRAFVTVEEEDGYKDYKDILTVMSDDSYRAQHLARALKELNAWKRKYKDLKELAAIFEAADRIERKMRPEKKQKHA